MGLNVIFLILYENIDRVVQLGAKRLNLDNQLINEYFERLDCDLNSEKIKAMETFFKDLYYYRILKELPKIEFFKCK